MKKHELIIVMTLSMIPLWAFLAFLISIMWDALGGEGNVAGGAMISAVFIILGMAPVLVYVVDQYKEPKP